MITETVIPVKVIARNIHNAFCSMLLNLLSSTPRPKMPIVSPETFLIGSYAVIYQSCAANSILLSDLPSRRTFLYASSETNVPIALWPVSVLTFVEPIPKPLFFG